MTRAVYQPTNPKPQPLKRLTLDTMITPGDYEVFLVQWERYREGCL